MTCRQWRELDLPMVWDLFDREDRQDPEDAVLRLDAYVPDGVYKVTDGHGPAVDGVTVRDGSFVAEPTADACYEATARGYSTKLARAAGGRPLNDAEIAHRVAIDHVYIERLRFSKTDGVFRLSTRA